MSRSRLALVPVLALLLAAAAVPGAARADVPKPGALYETGPSGRYLLGGSWLFRLDPGDRGLRSGWSRSTAVAGWTRVTVPNAWNVTDTSDAAYLGGVGWYRKDFTLPSAAAAHRWIVRFESVNYRARVWLNGTPVGSNTGAYLPFEVDLPARALHRRGVNHLTIRVDSRRKPTDLPPSGLSIRTHRPVGGWWNYSGLLREVYLRRVDHVDFATVQLQPHVGCATCTASVTLRATVRNLDAHTNRVRVAGLFGTKSFDLGTQEIGRGRTARFSGRVRIAHPKLWAPDSPSLYPVRLTAQVGPGTGRSAQTWSTHSGIRKIRVVGGLLYLNGRRLNVRGFGLHEDSLDKGFAIDNATRERIVSAVQELGGTMMRSHYPLHPQLLELADRRGLLVWSEIPMYQVKNEYLALASVRRAGVAMLRRNILVNGNHPSIAIWSIGNELNSKPGRSQAHYIRSAVRAAHALDPTRPVGLAYAGNPTARCQKAYGPLDVLGLNEYFNWYPGPNGSTADPDLLSEFLDRQHACYAKKAMLVTETGAEANREGPAEERGTYAFQQAFANWQFETLASKSWLSGALWWALQEFRVRPDWDGGDARPNPPFHQKGVLTLDWQKKPAWYDLQRIFTGTEQIGS